MISIASMFAADNAVETTLGAEPGQARLPPVDQNGDLVAAAERDVSFVVDRHTRKIPHRVEDRSGRLRRPVIQPEHLRVDAREPDRLGGDRHVFGIAFDSRQADVAQVVRVVQRTEQHVRFGFEESGKRHANRVLAGRETL
jgi:hypothetical protein